MKKKRGVDYPRFVALAVLNRVEARDSFTDITLDTLLRDQNALSPLDKAFITELVYGTLRWRMRIDWIISRFSSIKPSKMEREVLNILRLGIYQLVFLEKVPPSAAIDESVKLTGNSGETKKKGFVNGVLRRIEREKDRVPYPDSKRESVKYISTFYSHPHWIIERWAKRFGIKETVSICEINNTPPPFTLRVNRMKTARKECLRFFSNRDIQAEPTSFSMDGIRLSNPGNLKEGIEKGLFLIQDEASQLISYILNPENGEVVLDVCAAPGGKATHIATLMEDRGRVIAMDINSSRLSLIKDNVKRLGITSIETLQGDAVKRLDNLPVSYFDKIIIDAPCSGLGVLRRNPDARYRRKEDDIHRLASLQGKILRNISRYVKKGGNILYSTCSIEPEENEEVIMAFLKENNLFSIEDISKTLPEKCRSFTDKEGFFRILPHKHNMDGFFAARLKRVG